MTVASKAMQILLEATTGASERDLRARAQSQEGTGSKESKAR